MVFSFENLTGEQREFICNGCGAKGGNIPVPNFAFKASCDRHDFGYWVGGTEKDRRRIDSGFGKALRKDAGWDPGLWCWAFFYLRGVKAFGSSYFYYGEPRGWKELELEMNKESGDEDKNRD